MKWKLSTDFTFISADKYPADWVEKLIESPDDWVVLQDLTLPSKSDYYVFKGSQVTPHLVDLGIVQLSLNPLPIVQEYRPSTTLVFDRKTQRILDRIGPVKLAKHAAAGVAVLGDKPYGIIIPETDVALASGLDLTDVSSLKDLLRKFKDSASSPVSLGDGRGFNRIAVSNVLEKEVPAVIEGDQPSLATNDPDLVECTVAATFPDCLGENKAGELTLMLALGDVQLADDQTLIEAHPGEEMHAVVSLSANLEFASASEDGRRSLRIPASKDAPPVRTSLEIRGKAAGPAWIKIRLFQGNPRAMVGWLQLKRDVKPQCVAEDASSRTETARTNGRRDCPPADLTLHVDESRLKDKVIVHFSISAGPGYPAPNLWFYPMGETILDGTLADYFRAKFQFIEHLQLEGAMNQAAAQKTIKKEGASLYDELFPAELKDELEKNGRKIKTICVHCEESHVPWEMIVLPDATGQNAARPNEYMSLRYEVTRWMSGYSPQANTSVRRLGLLTPTYAPGSELLFAADEATFIKGLLHEIVFPMPTELSPIIDFLDAGDFDICHFIGHGVQDHNQADVSSIELQAVEVGPGGMMVQPTVTNYLTPIHFKGETNWAKRRPLIFLNACQTARRDSGLLRPGGWASAALGSQANAFIGTLWSVRDTAAFLFSRTFYEKLFGGNTIGESALAARRAVNDTGDPSWLAYVVYAHPNCRVSAGSVSPEKGSTE